MYCVVTSVPPAPCSELSHSCTSQCPVPCDAASSGLPPVFLPVLGGGPESCGNGDKCAYPYCGCPFMPGPGDKNA